MVARANRTGKLSAGGRRTNWQRAGGAEALFGLKLLGQPYSQTAKKEKMHTDVNRVQVSCRPEEAFDYVADITRRLTTLEGRP